MLMGTLPLVQLAPEWEDTFSAYQVDADKGLDIALPPDLFNQLANGVSQKINDAQQNGIYPVVVTNTHRRRFLHTLMRAKGISSPVLSFEEIGAGRKTVTRWSGSCMMQSLAAIMELTDAALWQGFVVFLRVSALVSLLPGFGEQSIPARVKLGIAIAFTFIISPAAPPPPYPMQIDSVIWICLTEITAGFLLGIGIRLLILGLQTAGSIAAQSTSLAQILGGAVAEPVPAMGHILVMGGLALAMMAGLHVRVAEMAILSYDMLPMGRFPSGSDVSEWGVDQVRYAFSLAFTLAAPFVVLSVLYNVALGVINKAMPQLMVAFVGAPLITAGGLLVLTLAAPLLLSTWLEALNSFIANPLKEVP